MSQGLYRNTRRTLRKLKSNLEREQFDSKLLQPSRKSFTLKNNLNNVPRKAGR